MSSGDKPRRGATRKTSPTSAELGLGVPDGHERVEGRRRWVDALHTRLRLFAGGRQKSVHVLAEIAGHKSDMDPAHNRVDAQCPRIRRILGLGLEGERIARTKASNFLLRRRASVVQPVNEEHRPVAARGVSLRNREDLEHVGLALSTTSGKHDERVGFPAIEIERFDELFVVGAALGRQSIPEHREQLRGDVDLVEVWEAAQRTESGTFSRPSTLRIGEHVVSRRIARIALGKELVAVHEIEPIGSESPRHDTCGFHTGLVAPPRQLVLSVWQAQDLCHSRSQDLLVALYSHISPARENQNFLLVPIASALAGASSGTAKTVRGSAGTVNRAVGGDVGQALRAKTSVTANTMAKMIHLAW